MVPVHGFLTNRHIKSNYQEMIVRPYLGDNIKSDVLRM